MANNWFKKEKKNKKIFRIEIKKYRITFTVRLIAKQSATRRNETEQIGKCNFIALCVFFTFYIKANTKLYTMNKENSLKIINEKRKGKNKCFLFINSVLQGTRHTYICVPPSYTLTTHRTICTYIHKSRNIAL